MICKKSAARIVEFSKAVQKYSKASDKKSYTAVEEENRRRAWVLLKNLIKYCEHIERCDMFDMMSIVEAKDETESEHHYTAARDEWIAALIVAAEFEKNLKTFEKTSAKEYVKKLKKAKTEKKPAKVKADAQSPAVVEVSAAAAKTPKAKKSPPAKKPAAKKSSQGII